MSLKRLLLLFVVLLGGAGPVVSRGMKGREKRSDDAGPLQVVVDQLAQQVTSLSAQLTQQGNSFNAQVAQLNAQLAQQKNSCNAQIAQQNSSFTTQLAQQAHASDTQLSNVNAEIAALKHKTDTLAHTVAFYAWNNVQPMHTAAGGILVFDHAVTNVGSAYSTLTGVFTAPVSGLYHFQCTFLSANFGGGNYAHADIHVDNSVVARGISDTRSNFWDQTTISSVVHVSTGQHVYVKNVDNKANDYHGSVNNPHTTFSGFLIRAD